MNLVGAVLCELVMITNFLQGCRLSNTIETAALAFTGLSKFSADYYDPRFANFQPSTSQHAERNFSIAATPSKPLAPMTSTLLVALIVPIPFFC